MNVGSTIRKLRKEKKMTLLELSNGSGVALATLSRMENGKMTGTLESHINICRALELPLTKLYADLVAQDRRIEVQPRKSRADVSLHDSKAASEMLAPNISGKKMMPVMVRISRGGQTHADETRIGVEKFIYILDGRIQAVIGEDKYNLAKGDTIYFDSSTPHRFLNTGASEARLISVVSPPTV